ncbi:MAG: beta-propeller fold lactonase family protein [Luteibacter sp.]
MHAQRLIPLSALVALVAAGSAHAQTDFSFPLHHSSNLVFVMSNDIHDNKVAVLRRNFFGGLDKVGTASTGGKGVGVGTTAPPPDPLGSQNALAVSNDGRLLFATNAGSNEVSVFAILGSRLQLVDVVPSGGTYPVSVAQRGNRLYVLNSAGTSTVTAFEIAPTGQLVALPHETRVLGTNAPLVGNQPNVGMTPAQVQLTPDGRWLAVSVKDASAKGWFELFAIDRQGHLANDPTISASDDPQPFGFDFDGNGHLVTSQAAGSAASSYSVASDGSLKAISTDVANGQKAACWLTVAGGYAYTANAGTGTVSAYRIGRDGRLSLEQAVAGKLEAGAAPTDIKASDDGAFVYVGNSLGGNVDTFLALPGGHLLKIGQTSVFAGASGMQGLAL